MPPADEIFECAAYLTLLEATRGDSSTAEWARTVLHEVDDCSKLDWDAGRELLRRVLTEKESGGLSEDLWLRLDNRLRIWSCRVDLAAFDATILLQLHRLCLLLSKGNRKRAAALMKRMEEEARAKDTAGERPEARARAPETRCVCGEIEADPEEERAFLELSVKEIENSLGEDARTIRELEPDEETLRALESLEELWRMLKEPRDKKKLAWQHKMLMRRKIRHLSECRHIAADVTVRSGVCLAERSETASQSGIQKFCRFKEILLKSVRFENL